MELSMFYKCIGWCGDGKVKSGPGSTRRIMKEYARLLRPRTAAIEAPAGFGRRAFALIFDILLLDLIITAPFTPLFTSMLARMDRTAWMSMTYTGAEMAAIAIVFLLAFAYFALFEYTIGQTPGMMLANIRARTQLTLWQAFVRNIFLLPAGPVIVLWIVEPIIVALKQPSLLERVSNTRTVMVRTVII